MEKLVFSLYFNERLNQPSKNEIENYNHNSTQKEIEFPFIPEPSNILNCLAIQRRVLLILAII